jgi:hypothetical protein
MDKVSKEDISSMDYRLEVKLAMSDMNATFESSSGSWDESW